MLDKQNKAWNNNEKENAPRVQNSSAYYTARIALTNECHYKILI